MAQIMQIEVIPEKPHIKISNKTINVPKELKYIATQFDHAAEKVTFDCPKIVGENINLLDTVLYVNYRLPDGSMSAHKAENVRVDETDEETIHFDWTFTRNVTQYKGDIYFLVCAVKTDVSGNQILRWSTTLNSEISVTEGIEGTEAIDEQYPDIITQILQDLAFKQDILVSGENIKTINGKSVLGGGDIVIDGEGTKNYDDLINKPRINGVELAGNRTAKELKITFDVDNTFDPESKNAQSGVAVKEATTELENKYFDVAYNMFTPETVTENTKISETDGTEVLSVGYSTSDYIELPTSGSYTAKSTEDYTFAIYTGANKRFVALVPAENPQSSIYMPDEMLPAFIRITFPTVDLNVVQINQGTTLLPYDDGRTKLRPEYYDTVSGKDGKSAYEIALGNGFEGSEEDWLASLKGEQGKAGKDGADGTSVTISSITENTEDSGNNVITFSDGNSVTIKNGSKGSKGDKGEQGIQGVQGEKGETGNAGKDGTSITVDIVSESPSDGGNNIVTFSDGSTLTVKNGNKGSKGDKGDTGATGPKGDKGDDYKPIVISSGSAEDMRCEYLGQLLLDKPNSRAYLSTESTEWRELQLKNNGLEHLQTIYVGYSLPTSEPEDFAVNYTSYYTAESEDIYSEAVFKPVAAGTAPEWKPDTYYTRLDTVPKKITLNLDAKGNVYNYDEVMIKVYCPKNTSDITTMYFRVMNGNTVLSELRSKYIYTNNATHGMVRFFKQSGFWTGEMVSAAYDTISSPALLHPSVKYAYSCSERDYPAVTAVVFGAQTSMVEGTRVTVYGIKRRGGTE